MPTQCLNYNKVPQAYLQRTGNVIKNIDSLPLHLKNSAKKKITVADGAILITYVNSAWKNTLETQLVFI
jgi:hypothetical protein